MSVRAAKLTATIALVTGSSSICLATIYGAAGGEHSIGRVGTTDDICGSRILAPDDGRLLNGVKPFVDSGMTEV